jgi:AraC-like DNA-binding protein
MAPGGGSPHRVLPDGASDLLFNFGDPLLGSDRPRAPGGHVIGIMTRSILSRPSGRVDVLGVRFRPGEAFAFLGVEASALRDETQGLVSVWGAAGRVLEDRLAELPREARIAQLERELLARLPAVRPADHRIRAAVSLLEGTGGRIAVGELGGRAGLGERQLERAFRERVGIGPKALARVIRLQTLVARLGETRRGRAWSAIAAEVGYADQAHLIREVRGFSGVTPTELARERG